MWQRMALAVAALVLIGFAQSVSLPVLDEETYLYIAEQLNPKRPYDWVLPWPPYDTDDAFIFAHPPLFLWWVWLLYNWFELGLGWSKFLAALPFQVMLGCAAVVILPRRNRLGLALFCVTPIVSLSIARGLMPDLSVTAFGASAMALWWLGEQHKTERYATAAGVLIGAAILIKYPAALLLCVPLLHSKCRRRMLACLLSGVAVWLVGEVWLWTIYDRIHIVEVLQRANEISRGPLLERAAGVFVRISIGAPIILFLAAQRQTLSAVGAVLGVALWGWVALPWALLPLVTIGAAAFGALVGDFFKNQEDAWLATWALLVLVGVLGGHNFAAPRYCLPAMLPIVALISRRKMKSIAPAVIGLVGLCSMGLSFMIGVGERSYVKAAAALAQTVSGAHEPGYYSGEWTFRYSMRQAGWSFWRGEALCDQHIAVAIQAAPAAVSEFWTPLQQWEGQIGSIRLLQAKTSTGYYAETVGKMPLMWSKGPLEQVQLWKSPSCSLQ